jgi:predicted DNA-binding transcriptional regulator AlpA
MIPLDVSAHIDLLFYSLAMKEKATQAIELVRLAAREAAAAGELPAFLGALEAVRVEAILATHQAVEPGAGRKRDRVLTVKQTAERLGRSPSWVYKNKNGLPGVRFSTGGYGFSERRLEEWIRRQTRG